MVADLDRCGSRLLLRRGQPQFRWVTSQANHCGSFPTRAHHAFGLGGLSNPGEVRQIYNIAAHSNGVSMQKGTIAPPPGVKAKVVYRRYTGN